VLASASFCERYRTIERALLRPRADRDHEAVFSLGNQWDTFAKALLRIAVASDPKSMFYEAWVNVARYPVLRLMYAGGVAACASDSFGVLRLLIEPRLRPRPHEAEASLVTVLHHGAAFAQRYWKWLPGMERHHFAVSDYLEESLRPALREFSNDGEEVSASFDRFRVFPIFDLRRP